MIDNFGDYNDNNKMLTIKMNKEIFETLLKLDSETDLVGNEIISQLSQLFSAKPIDDRNPLVKFIDRDQKIFFLADKCRDRQLATFF